MKWIKTITLSITKFQFDEFTRGTKVHQGPRVGSGGR